MWKRLDPKISTSEKHAKFGFSPLTLWVMMLPHTDSQGRYWANASYIKGQCLPLFDHVRLEQIEQALLDLQEVRLLHLYDSNGKRYLVYHDVEDFNPPGALRYAKPQWPEPQAGVCRCVDSRRVSAVNTHLVSSPSSLTSSSTSEGVQGEPKPVASSPEGLLASLALAAKIIHASERQLRTHISGWVADKGFQRVEEILMNPAVRGKDVFWIHEQFFKAQKNGKPPPLGKKKVINPKCPKCSGRGRRFNPATNSEMDCNCVREVAV